MKGNGMGHEASGTLKVLNDTRVISDKFRLREFVLETPGKYPQPVLFQVVNEKCDELDAWQIGDHVSVCFDVRGREWKNDKGEVRYFNSLSVWKFQRNAGEALSSEAGAFAPDGGDDDIPF